MRPPASKKQWIGAWGCVQVHKRREPVPVEPRPPHHLLTVRPGGPHLESPVWITTKP